MNCYEDYLTFNDHIAFDQFNEIYKELLSEVNLNDPEVKELWEDMLESAFVYANRRAHWSIQDSATRREVDEHRTHEHNDFMTNLNIIARYLKVKDKETAWLSQMGTPEKDRKRFGDFACYLAFVHSLNAR